MPTPESDIDDRQREPIGPERLAEEAEGIRNSLGGAGGQSTGARDAGTDDGGGDASTD